MIPLLAAAAVASTSSLSALDLISLEIVYTTVLARYYRPVEGATLLAGARDGMSVYLRGRGITPHLAALPKHADRWQAENAIDQDVAVTVARYGRRVDPHAVTEAAIAGELAALHDPYSVLLRAQAYRQFVAFLDGRGTAGIGAELDVDPATHAVRVVDVFPGSPAERAGLRAGDRITAIDGASPASSSDRVAGQLRGAPGTAVRIAASRGTETLAPLTIVRAVVTAPDVLARPLGEVGYIRIRTFGSNAPKQFDAALAALREARAIVIDLRGDGGGYRDAAIAIASHLVDGTIVTTRERGAAPQIFAAKPAPKIGLPFAILVDGNTASASEIVAGAVQDRRAATLVGTKTFGKGLVQEVFPMPGGAAIKVTTASYVTPAGRDIEGSGIVPDLVVPEPPDARFGEPGADAQLDRALELLRSAAAPPSRSSGA